MKYRCADLFCCAGGAAMGLHRSGFEVEGWDIKPQKHYPFKFHLGDALAADLTGFDFVWASPPCQEHTALRVINPDKHYECFIERTREKLTAWGGPWIIENVVGAPLRNPVQVCGSAFAGLRVRRHRLFESRIPLFGTGCYHRRQVGMITVCGTGGKRINRRKDDHGGCCNFPESLEDARDAMGITWMSRRELSQAIPPAYSEFLGKQIIRYLDSK